MTSSWIFVNKNIIYVLDGHSKITFLWVLSAISQTHTRVCKQFALNCIYTFWRWTRSTQGCWGPGSSRRQFISIHGLPRKGVNPWPTRAIGIMCVNGNFVDHVPARGNNRNQESVGWQHTGNSMMVSWNGNIFRITGPLWGEFTGHRRIMTSL